MKKEVKIKFLGTSSGEPIPRSGCQCSQCISKNPKDKRLRSSILIEKKILVDATPDILVQLTKSQIEKLDTVIITHEHNDHVGGLKHILRVKPDIRIIRMKSGQHFKLFGIEFFAFKILHSNLVATVGLEIENRVLYIPDSLSLSSALRYLQDAETAILDGSVFGRTMSGHLALNEIVATVKPFKNLKKIYFTHNGHTKIAHKNLEKTLKEIGDNRFTPAYDGLEVGL